MQKIIREFFLLLGILAIIGLLVQPESINTYSSVVTNKKQVTELKKVKINVLPYNDSVKKEYLLLDETKADVKIRTYNNGLRIVRPIKFNNKKQILSMNDIYQLYSKLDDRLKPLVKEIQIVDYPDSEDSEAENPGSYDNTISMTDEAIGKIIFFGTSDERNELGHVKFNELMLETMRHETAHIWDWQLGSSSEYSDEKEWKSACSKDKNFVSGYAKEAVKYDNSYAEDFADAVAKYLDNKKSFEKKYSNRSRVLDKLIKSKKLS